LIPIISEIDDHESLRTETEEEKEPSMKAMEDPFLAPPVIAVNEYYEIQITPSEDPMVLFDNGEFLDQNPKNVIKKSPTFNKQSYLVRAHPSSNQMAKRSMTRSCSPNNPGNNNLSGSYNS
jgi:hypothetical protein